jgi:hypothetical protein
MLVYAGSIPAASTDKSFLNQGDYPCLVLSETFPNLGNLFDFAATFLYFEADEEF